MDRINVYADSGQYDILVGDGVITRLGDLMRDLRGRILVVSDQTVAQLVGAQVLAPLREAGREALLFTFDLDEDCRSHESLLSLYAALVKEKFTRDDIIVALGGSGICSLVGYAAATYRFGMRYVRVPTTLYSQVECSVGGAVSVDLPGAKAAAAVHHNPSLVVADTSLLKALPETALRDGIAELIRYAASQAGSMWAEMEDVRDVRSSWKRLQGWVASACRIRADEAMRGKLQKGEVAPRFGEFMCRAIETASEGAISHGEALSVSMAMAARWGERLGTSIMGTSDQLARMLRSYSFPTQPPSGIDREKTLAALFSSDDPQRPNAQIVLLRQIGGHGSGFSAVKSFCASSKQTGTHSTTYLRRSGGNSCPPARPPALAHPTHVLERVA